jgi:LSD1 subclass zinc finger protein
MPVAQELLDLLVCPACKTPVSLTEQKDGLRCATCGRTYPIVDDIPVMLLDKAKQS